MIHWNGNKRKLLLIQIPWNHSQAYIIHRLLGMAPRVEFLATSSRDVKIFSFFLREPIFLLCSSLNAHTYACMHARTHARARARTHTHTHERTKQFSILSRCPECCGHRFTPRVTFTAWERQTLETTLRIKLWINWLNISLDIIFPVHACVWR